MTLARVHTWVSGEVLTASDLNAEFNSILNNPTALITPLTGNLALGAFSLTGLGAGTASTPSLSFTGDTNTGLFSPAADQISLSAGGGTAFSVVSRAPGTAYAEFAQSAAIGERFYPPLTFGNPDDGVMSVSGGTIDLIAGGRRVLRASAYANATNYLLVSPSQSGLAVRLEVAGADTDVGLVIDTKNAGGLILGSADTGGISAATHFVPVSISSNPPIVSALYAQNTPKAWVNFTGRNTNGTAVINSSFNVSDVTRTAAGSYTITYRRAFIAASNYSVTGSAFISGNSAVAMGLTAVPTTTTVLVIFFSTNTATAVDPHECMVTVMGNQ